MGPQVAMLNIYASNSLDEELFVTCLNAHRLKKTSGFLARIIKDVMLKMPPGSVSQLVTDRGSNCIGARSILMHDIDIEAHQPNISFTNCQEHVGHSVTGDILKVVPWLGDSCKATHKTTKFFTRKKRCNAYLTERRVQAKRQGVIRHNLKLKGVRKTRFCSHHRTMRGWVINRGIIMDALTDPAFLDCFDDKTKRSSKFDYAKRVVMRDGEFARSVKSAKVFEPLTVFTRIGGGPNFGRSLVSTVVLKQSFLAMLDREDFLDQRAGVARETLADKTARRNRLIEILDRRIALLRTDSHYAAAWLDASNKDHFNSAEPAIAQIFFEGLARTKAYLEKFYRRDDVNRQRALNAFSNYIGISHDLVYPLHKVSTTCSKMDVRKWWLEETPDNALATAAVHLLSHRGSQGLCERGWAMLTRYSTPLRNMLAAESKRIRLILL